MAEIFAGGDPSKVDVSGYAKGDILAADATGTLQVVSIGTNAEVLTVDTTQAQSLEYDPAGGGGGSVTSVFGRAGVVVAANGDYTAAQVGADVSGAATTAQANAIAASNRRLVLRQAYITAGDTTFPNTAGLWAPLTGYELQIPAAVGDYVEISVNGMKTEGAIASVDCAVISGVTLVRFMATGTSSPGFEGNPGWYFAAGFTQSRGPQGFTVTSGDRDGGNVRFVIATKSTGVGSLFSDSNYPFYWCAKNWGPVN